MELTDEIRKEVLKELINKFERAIKRAEEEGIKNKAIEEWKGAKKWLNNELEWYYILTYMSKSYEGDNK